MSAALARTWCSLLDMWHARAESTCPGLQTEGAVKAFQCLDIQLKKKKRKQHMMMGESDLD